MKLSKITEDKYNELPDEDYFVADGPQHFILDIYSESGEVLTTLSLYVQFREEWQIEWLSRSYQYYDIFEVMDAFGSHNVIYSILTMINHQRRGGRDAIRAIASTVGFDDLSDLHGLTNAIIALPNFRCASLLRNLEHDVLINIINRNPQGE